MSPLQIRSPLTFRSRLMIDRTAALVPLPLLWRQASGVVATVGSAAPFLLSLEENMGSSLRLVNEGCSSRRLLRAICGEISLTGRKERRRKVRYRAPFSVQRHGVRRSKQRGVVAVRCVTGKQVRIRPPPFDRGALFLEQLRQRVHDRAHAR